MKRSLVVWTATLSLVFALFGLTAVSGVAAQSATDDPGQVDAGQMVYESSCAGCHGVDGSGVEGLGRPLTDIASQQSDRSVHIASVADGKGGMPAFGEQLSGEEIDAAISYVRLTFVSDAAAAPEELASTGTETTVLAVGGSALIAAGLLLTQISRESRRRSD